MKKVEGASTGGSKRWTPARRGAAALLLVVTVAGCRTTGTSEPVPGALAGSPATLPPAIHWTRNSAEHQAVFRQVYAAASDRVRQVAEGRAEGTWGVILDADETVLDNSTYQRRLAATGATFSGESWNAWVREEAAGAKPGAADFIELVRRMGGVVAIVTNRDEAVCDPTRRNLGQLGIVVDVVLCQQPNEEGKGGRFRAVQEGRASPDLPPVDVVLWLGDNIRDFPGLDQELRDRPAGAFALFGRRYFLLPNPMYGSWERNPIR